MASRAGSFSYRPYRGSNMTATIASLFAQQQSAEDTAIFDAYNNGGDYKGKPVDDTRILGYIKGRRDGYSKDDPLYSQWDERLTQTQFTIGESKASLAFKQGKLSAGGMAAFYRSWLKKIPADSAFGRKVASNAADWAKSAASAARGAASSRLSAEVSAAQKRVDDAAGSYNAIDATLTAYAQRAGMISGTQTLTDASAESLDALLALGIQDPATGKPITLSSWRSAAAAYYKSFDTAIAVNNKLGRGVKELIAAKGKFFNQTVVRINAVDDRAKYEAARQSFDQAQQNAHGDPYAIRDAQQAYAQSLLTIRGNALTASGSNENDPQFIGGLLNEANAYLTGQSSGATVFDLQKTSGEGSVTTEQAQAGGSSDAARAAAANIKVGQDIAALQDGTAYYGQTAPGTDLAVHQLPTVAAIDPTGRNGLADNQHIAWENVDGTLRKVVLAGTPVRAAAITDKDGKPIPVGNLTGAQIKAGISAGIYKQVTTDIGYVFIDPLATGGRSQTLYAVKQADGTFIYTRDDPFSGHVYQDTNNGVTSLYVANDTVLPPPGQPAAADVNAATANLSSIEAAGGAANSLYGASASEQDIIRLSRVGELQGANILGQRLAQAQSEAQISQEQATAQAQQQALQQQVASYPAASQQIPGTVISPLNQPGLLNSPGNIFGANGSTPPKIGPPPSLSLANANAPQTPTVKLPNVTVPRVAPLQNYGASAGGYQNDEGLRAPAASPPPPPPPAPVTVPTVAEPPGPRKVPGQGVTRV